MSVIATAVRHLMAAGVTGEALLTAIADLEASLPGDAVAEKRRAYDRQRKRDAKAANSTGIPPESTECPEPLILEVSPHTPLPNPDLDIPPYNPPNSIEPETPALRPEHVIEYWNDRAAVVGLPKATLTPKRRRGLTTRIRVHPVEHWTEAIDAIERSSFLLGDNDRGWRATFDFLLRPDSIAKLREGTYDRSAN